ncbi:putative necrosis-inducing factor-domain-containing protein, partial [Cercophora newfieldiana]
MRCQQEGSKNTHLVRWGLYNSWNKPERLARGSPKALAARNTGLSRRMANDCGLTDIVDQTTEGSPLIEDCKEIVRIYNTDQMTTFTFEADGSQHRVFQTGTCAFGVQTYCPNGQCPKKGILVKIGDEDVRDLVQLSIDTFPWKGRVGALGHM